MFDIADPTAPQLLTRVPLPGGGTKIATDDRQVIVLTKGGALISVWVDGCVEWAGNEALQE